MSQEEYEQYTESREAAHFPSGNRKFKNWAHIDSGIVLSQQVPIFMYSRLIDLLEYIVVCTVGKYIGILGFRKSQRNYKRRFKG